MTTMTVSERVRESIAKSLSLGIEAVTVGVTLEDLGTDSLDIVEIVIDLEAEFGVPVPDDDVESWCYVADIIRWFQDRTT